LNLIRVMPAKGRRPAILASLLLPPSVAEAAAGGRA